MGGWVGGGGGGPSLLLYSRCLLTDALRPFLPLLTPTGASLADFDLGPIELGKARRSGSVADSVDLPAGEAEEGSPAAAAAAGAVALAQAQQQQNGAGAAALAMTSDGEADAGAAALAAAAAAAPAVPQINRRCKRRRRELLEAAA